MSRLVAACQKLQTIEPQLKHLERLYQATRGESPVYQVEPILQSEPLITGGEKARHLATVGQMLLNHDQRKSEIAGSIKHEMDHALKCPEPIKFTTSLIKDDQGEVIGHVINGKYRQSANLSLKDRLANIECALAPTDPGYVDYLSAMTNVNQLGLMGQAALVAARIITAFEDW